MFKFIAILIGLVTFGTYSLLTEDTDQPAPVVSQSDPTFMAQMGLGYTASSAVKMTGLELHPIPSSGCSSSVLTPAQVISFVNLLPDMPRLFLAKAMDATSSMWTAQLYSGDLGVGLCLPMQGKFLKFPDSIPVPDWKSTEDVADSIRGLGNAVKPK